MKRFRRWVDANIPFMYIRTYHSDDRRDEGLYVDGQELFMFLTTFFVFLPFGLVALYTVFAYVPTKLVAEAECLEQGYPKSRVTFWLDEYCVSPYSSLGDTGPKVIKND